MFTTCINRNKKWWKVWFIFSISQHFEQLRYNLKRALCDEENKTRIKTEEDLEPIYMYNYKVYFCTVMLFNNE